MRFRWWDSGAWHCEQTLSTKWFHSALKSPAAQTRLSCSAFWAPPAHPLLARLVACSTNGKNTLSMLTHPLSVANATASLLLNRAIDNFQWGPPSGQNVGPHKAPPFKANCTIWFFDKFILFTKKAGHKSLAKPLALQTHMAQRLLPILWFGSYEMQESCKMLTAGISFLSCPSQRTMMDYASIQNRCKYQGRQCTTGWPLCERMREMMIVQYSQCLWFEGCRVYHLLETYQCDGS